MTPAHVGPLEESRVWVDERSTVPGRRALSNAHGASCKIAELSSGLEKLHSPSAEEKENARDKIKRNLPTIVSCLTALNNARQVIEDARNNGKWPMTSELEKLARSPLVSFFDEPCHMHADRRCACESVGTLRQCAGAQGKG